MNLVRLQHTERMVARARSELSNSHFNLAWQILEEAHIYSQPFAGMHIYVHWEMLLLALKEKSISEAFGQTLRLLLAGPSSLLKTYPAGNTGRSNIGLFSSMPLPKRIELKIQDLEKLEKVRIKNGGTLPKHERKHPLNRN